MSLFGYNEKLKFDTGNETYFELLKDSLLHFSKVLTVLTAPLCRSVLTLNGVKFGKNVKVYGIPRIENRGRISLGNNMRLNSALCTYNSGNMQGPVLLRTTKTGCIEIGDEVYLNGTTIVSDERVLLGSRIMIGANTVIMDTNTHNIPYRNRLKRWDKIDRKPVTVSDDVWIGANCFIMKGVTIGRGSVIGAGSVVVKDVEEFSVYAGNPAVFIKRIEDE